MVDAFAAACGKPVPYELCPRRPGDIAECWASTEKAERELGWKATRTVDEMTVDTWNWQSNNPNGYSRSNYSRRVAICASHGFGKLSLKNFKELSK